jgi:thiol-disulfide isomerase/thioredoxin
MDILNQYSYIFVSLFVIAAATFAARRLRLNWIMTGGIGIAAAVIMIVALVVLRPGASDVDSAAAAQALINSGKPTFVEFYSNYCAGCVTVRPVVDLVVSDIQTRYGEDFNILRIDIHTEFGRVLREQYGFSFTPEFVLFNPAGVEVWRSHLPPTSDQINLAIASENVADSNLTQ